MSEKVELIISARNKARQAMRQFSGEINTITRRVFNLRTAIVGLGGIYAIDRLVDKFETLSGVQEKAEAGMLQAMKSMGRYTDELHQKMLRVASDIQAKTTFGDEAVIEGQKFLMTYKDITDDLLPRTSEAMADLAALMGGDTKQAANMLGKASMGMTGELRRAGITVDENIYKTQGFLGVLKEIERQVKGQAAAIAATKAGGLEQFGNVISDIEEKFGYFTSTVKNDIALSILPSIKNLDKQLGEMKENGRLDEWARNAADEIAVLINTSIRGMGTLLHYMAEVVRFIEKYPTLSKYGVIGWFLKGRLGAAVIGFGAVKELLDTGAIKRFFDSIFKKIDEALGVEPEGSSVVRGRLDNWIDYMNKRASAATIVSDALDKLSGSMKNYELVIDRTKHIQGKSILEIRRDKMAGDVKEWVDPWGCGLVDIQDATDEAFNYMEEMSRETARHMQNNFSDFFFDAVKGKFKSFEDYWRSFTDGLLRIWSDMVSQQVMVWLLGQQFMQGNSSQVGGWVGIAKAAILAYVSSQGGGTAGPAHVGAGGTTAFGMHSGGIGGREASFYRTVPASVFANAPYHHDGVGPGEKAAIIRDDEGVFTPGQMKAMGLMTNQGGGDNYIFHIVANDAKSFEDMCKRNPGAIIGPVTQALRDNQIRTGWKGILNR